MGSWRGLGLLPIGPHDHPDPHTMVWSESELRAIRLYAVQCVAADRAKWRELAQRVAHQGNARGLEGLAVLCTISESGAVVSWEVGRGPNVADKRRA